MQVGGNTLASAVEPLNCDEATERIIVAAKSDDLAPIRHCNELWAGLVGIHNSEIDLKGRGYGIAFRAENPAHYISKGAGTLRVIFPDNQNVAVGKADCLRCRLNAFWCGKV